MCVTHIQKGHKRFLTCPIRIFLSAVCRSYAQGDFERKES